MRGRGLLLLGAIVAIGIAGPALAAKSPFGIVTPDSAGGSFGGPLAPFFAWVAARQAEFYKAMTGMLAASREDGSAAWLLLGLSFLYGVFHAAGPGHGKAVITSYLLASRDSVRQGVAVSFAAAFVQAVTAILFVGIAVLVFRATARSMTEATDWIEIASYSAIVLVGAWLLWSKTFGGGHHHHHHHGVGELHVHGPGCGHHPTGVLVAEAATENVLYRAWSAILAVGIRPCSGAIIVLVFAVSQGLVAAGIAATLAMALGTGLTVAVLAGIAVSAKGFAFRLAGASDGRGEWVLRGIEILGALAVLLFGLTLLGGALSGALAG